MVSRSEHDLHMAGLSTSMLVYRRIILKIGELRRSKKQVNEIHLIGSRENLHRKAWFLPNFLGIW